MRYRIPGQAGHYARATGLSDTPAHRRQLERLRVLVGAVIRAGKDPTPILEQHLAGRVRAAAATVTRPAAAPTLRMYYEQWIAEQTPLVRRAQARDYARHLTGYVLPVLGDVPVAALSASEVRGLQVELLTRGRPRVPGGGPPRRGVASRHQPLSVKTVRNILGGSLRAMLRQARKDGLLTRERFADLVELEWPQHTTPEPDPFTADECTRLLAWFETRTFRVRAGGYVLQRHPAYHAYLHLLFSSGMRPSEAAGLQGQDVDLGRATAAVRRSRHLWSYGEPKTTSARRIVQLFPETVRLLRALQPLRVDPAMPVFPHTGGGPLEPNSLLPHWYAAQRACGIRVRGLYATKDTFVTTALDANQPIAWLEQQTGVTYATLRKHYGKWMPGDRDRELRRFAEVAPWLAPCGSKLATADFVPGDKPKRGQR